MCKNSALVLMLTFAIACAGSAQARSWYDWIAPPLEIPAFESPYLYDSKTPHAYSWTDQGWDKESWARFRSSEAAVISDFYTAGILTDQYKEGEMLVLEVGEAFMRLSNQDKTKVADYVDHVYGVTQNENGIFSIMQEESCVPVGLYTKHGLQLQ